jgi:hypothetical protein
MKRIEDLTAKEKYEILIWADSNLEKSYLCDRISYSIDARHAPIIYQLCDIQFHFHMFQFKPKNKGVFWWSVDDPAREEAWKKLIEYWKHEAEKL